MKVWGKAAFLERMKPLVKPEEWEAFVNGITQPLEKSIRLKNSALKTILEKEGWHLLSVEGISEAFLVTRDDQENVPLGKTLAHFSGEVYVQTLSSMLPVISLDPASGEKILDLCAAPGSKSTFLSQRMGNTGVLVVNEMSASRIKKLVANLNRLGVCNAAVTQLDGSRVSQVYAQEFDKILLDAPCSSEGHGRKDASFFEKTWSVRSIHEAAKLQKKLIEQAFLVLKEGGEMVYSTCTMACEENEAVLEWFYERYKDFVEFLPSRLPSELPISPALKEFEGQKFSSVITKNAVRIWPHHAKGNFSSEAFFLCKIRKKRGVPLPQPSGKGNSATIRLLSKNQKAEKSAFLQKIWGLGRDIFEGVEMVEKGGSLFMAPKGVVDFAQRNFVQRLGMKIFDEHGGLSSEFLIHYGLLMNKNIVHLKTSQSEVWLSGRDLPLEGLEMSSEFDPAYEAVIRFDRFCLGGGKWMVKEGRLKNRLDSALRMG